MQSRASRFNDFIARNKLIEIPITGRKFTRISDDGVKFSKLDRFLVNDSFIGLWKDLSVHPLDRGVSDHCPLILRDKYIDYGPKPFKIFNEWFKCDGVDEIVNKACSKPVRSKRLDCMFRDKLKNVKFDLREWSKKVYGNLDYEINVLKIKVEEWEKKAECGDLNEHYQNSKFFHASIKRKLSKSNIRGLNINGSWNENPCDVKDAIRSHFQRIFESRNCDRPFFAEWVVEYSDQTASMGPDGPASYRPNTAAAVDGLSHASGPVNRPDPVSGSARESVRASRSASNRGFVHVGPKLLQLYESEATTLELPFCEKEIWDAINDCGGTKAPGPDGFNLSFYKKYWDVLKEDLVSAFHRFWILAKVLSNRLRKVIPTLVGFEQSAFIKGRNILDGVLIANETIDFIKKSKAKCLIFKVDFEKAFDSLSWDFLMEVMGFMGFGLKWRQWILSCLKSATISILVNGSPTSEFNLGRGVRQGDPLYPFLYILAAEGLNTLTKSAVNNNLFSGVMIGKDKVCISHLQYADDTIYFGEWNPHNIRNLMKLLKCFEHTSGLNVNYQKSMLFGLGVEYHEIEAMAKCFKCKIGSLPFNYLGLPIGANMKKLCSWKPVIDKFEKRLSDWKARMVSFGGRATLVKSVLNSLPFSTWANIIKVGANLQDIGVTFSNSFVKVIGNGSGTSFWHDTWVGDTPFSCKFKRLFKLEANPNVTVADRWVRNEVGWEGNWDWVRSPSRRTELELEDLKELLRDCVLIMDKCDSWRWESSTNSLFSTKRLTSIIDSKLFSVGSNVIESLQNNLVPKKVELFVWRSRRKHIPTLIELDKRGIDLHSVRCPLCDDGVESIDHALFFCKHAFEVWEKVFKWWGINLFSSASLCEILQGTSNVSMTEPGLKIWQAI
ncbi:uncharacterized protein [Rutidosis leptorrhynchoides]|uniref:uncharacterized protein n=1 Tax=Rutidosis leptorrhynchoides TaxID=125765 RepID=UPI003A9A4F97